MISINYFTLQNDYIEIIEKRLRIHWNTVSQKYENLFGIFAYGSPNYNLYIEGKSDIDTKVIYIPNFDDIFYEKIKSEEIKVDDEICNIKDIRKIIKEYSKGSIDVLQTLFTPYYIIPRNDYRTLWEKYFLKNRDKIVLSRSYEICRCAAAQAYNIALALKKTETWNGKKVADVMRLYYTINRYINTRDFLYSIYYFEKELQDKLIKIKTSLIEPKDFNKEEYRYIILFCENLKNLTKETFCDWYHFDMDYINFITNEVNETLKEGTKKIFAKKGIFNE